MLQYLFLNRINESISNFISRWNNHRLRLPKTSIFHHPKTGKEIRSMIPNDIYDNHPTNYGVYDKLTPFHQNPEIFNYLFGDNVDEDEDDELPQVKVNDALWELNAQRLQDFMHTFIPLTINDDLDECLERYKQAIIFLYVNN